MIACHGIGDFRTAAGTSAPQTLSFSQTQPEGGGGVVDYDWIGHIQGKQQDSKAYHIISLPWIFKATCAWQGGSTYTTIIYIVLMSCAVLLWIFLHILITFSFQMESRIYYERFVFLFHFYFSFFDLESFFDSVVSLTEPFLSSVTTARLQTSQIGRCSLVSSSSLSFTRQKQRQKQKQREKIQH